MNVGGLVPGKYIQEAVDRVSANVVLTFGRTGFFAYTPCSSSRILSCSKDPSTQTSRSKAMWWSTFPDSPPPVQRTTTNKPTNPAIPAHLQSRHGDWKDLVIHDIVTDLSGTSNGVTRNADDAKATLDVHTPTWIVRNLPRWAKNRVFLIGDAAHALPSISAQGVSQALEDSATIAMLLSKSQDSQKEAGRSLSTESTREMGREYERLRRPRCERILDEALGLQSMKEDLGWLGTRLMYFRMWLGHLSGVAARQSWKYDYGVEEALNTAQ